MFGVLRKPQLVQERVGGGPAGGGQRHDRVVSIAIQPEGRTDLVYAQREDLTWDPDRYKTYGSQRYVDNPARVEFDIDPDDPRKARNVRMVS